MRRPDSEAKFESAHRAAEVGGGEVADFEALFRAEYDGLCDFAERYVRTSAIAEELVQGVFLRVWERRAVLPPNAVTRAYLYAATRNAALQHGRHEQVDRRWREAGGAAGLAESTADAADAGVDLDGLEAAIERAIAALPERRRLIFTLSRHQGLRYAEIAEMLGISVGTVEVQMNRALKALRVQLAPYLLALLAVLR